MKISFKHHIETFLFEFQPKGIQYYSKIVAGFGLLNILILFPDIYNLFSAHGYISTTLNNEFVNWYEPSLLWITNPMQFIGLSYNMSLLLVILLYVMSLFFVITRYYAFTFSIVAWILHIMMVNSSYYFSYGADFFITFALFINVLLTSIVLCKDKKSVVTIRSFALRLLQIHLCLVYFFAGFGKIIGMDWLNGDAIWYVLHSFAPEMLENSPVAVISYPILFMILGWLTLCIELLYAIFIFHPKTKKLMLFSVIGMHFGIFIFMRLYTFAAIMIVLNCIAFGHYLSYPKIVNRTILLRWRNTYGKKIISNTNP